MRTFLLRARWPRLALVPLAVLIASALAATAFPALLPFDELTSPLPPEAVAAPPAAPVVARQEVEAEIINIGPGGFEPTEIARPAGRVLLAVDNRSGEEGLVLRLEQEGGERFYEGRATRGTNALRKVVNLRPGVYTLSEANHPEWQCRITITH